MSDHESEQREDLRKEEYLQWLIAQDYSWATIVRRMNSDPTGKYDKEYEDERRK